jgi:hypothetical protein
VAQAKTREIPAADASAFSFSFHRKNGADFVMTWCEVFYLERKKRKKLIGVYV